MIPPWSSAPSSRGGGLTTMGQATEIRPAAGQFLAQLLSRSCRKGPGAHHQALQELGLPRADQGIKHFVISSSGIQPPPRSCRGRTTRRSTWPRLQSREHGRDQLDRRPARTAGRSRTGCDGAGGSAAADSAGGLTASSSGRGRRRTAAPRRGDRAPDRGGGPDPRPRRAPCRPGTDRGGAPEDRPMTFNGLTAARPARAARNPPPDPRVADEARERAGPGCPRACRHDRAGRAGQARLRSSPRRSQRRRGGENWVYYPVFPPPQRRVGGCQLTRVFSRQARGRARPAPRRAGGPAPAPGAGRRPGVAALGERRQTGGPRTAVWRDRGRRARGDRRDQVPLHPDRGGGQKADAGGRAAELKLKPANRCPGLCPDALW